MNITKYRIEKSQSLEDLQKEVNIMIDLGWQPFGNLIYANNFYIQVMVTDDR